MTSFVRDLWSDWPGRLMLGVFAAVPLLFGLMIWLAKVEADQCASLGGRMLSKTSVGVGFTGNGQIATVPNTVSFCVSPDGRILF